MFIDADRERCRSVICSHHLLEEPFCCGNIPFSAEHEFYRLSLFIHCAVKILTRLPDLDVSLVNTEGRAAHLQMRSDALVDRGL